MRPKEDIKWYALLVTVIFLIMAGLLTSMLSTGLAWAIMDIERSVFWLVAMIAMLATLSGIVFTYSLVHYTQIPNLRTLIVMFLGANVVLFSFAFLVTHPNISLSVLATRDRNRTVVTALGFLLTPGVLADSLANNLELTKKRKTMVILWGSVLQPLFFVLLLAAPYPLFRVTDPEGGLVGLTPVGLVLNAVVGICASLALILYMIEWTRTGGLQILAQTFALTLWFSSYLIYAILESPLQVAEVLWVGGIFGGFLLIAIAMILTSIIEPHRVLESLVESRTAELVAARKESDFYLRMWVHKMGNLLQGIVTYLELLSEGVRGTELQKPHGTALALSSDATMFTRQVTKLSEIKSAKEVSLYPVILDTFLAEGLESVSHILQEKSVSVDVDLDKNQIVKADSMLSLLFSNIIMHALHITTDDPAVLRIRGDIQNGQVKTSIRIKGKQLSDTDKRILLEMGTPEISTLEMHLYIARLLIDRYNGSISYSRLEDEGENSYEISLNA